jgi:hypothetical protein
MGGVIPPNNNNDIYNSNIYFWRTESTAAGAKYTVNINK